MTPRPRWATTGTAFLRGSCWDSTPRGRGGLAKARQALGGGRRLVVEAAGHAALHRATTPAGATSTKRSDTSEAMSLSAAVAMASGRGAGHLAKADAALAEGAEAVAVADHVGIDAADPGDIGGVLDRDQHHVHVGFVFEQGQGLAVGAGVGIGEAGKRIGRAGGGGVGAVLGDLELVACSSMRTSWDWMASTSSALRIVSAASVERLRCPLVVAAGVAHGEVENGAGFVFAAVELFAGDYCL